MTTSSRTTMNVVAKQIQSSNVVFMWSEGSSLSPEPAELFACYSAEEAKGGLFSDHPNMGIRVFELPARGIQWVFEPKRTRLEEKKFRLPEGSKLAEELSRVVLKLKPGAKPSARGYNYDIIYRIDSVIPVSDVMKAFIKPDLIENVRDFGWQYSVSKDKGKRIETYFFKAVSPIEYAVHLNVHLDEPGLPKAADFERDFEREYAKVDDAMKHVAFH